MNPQNLRPPWPKGVSGNPGGRRSGFVGEIRRQTKDGQELVRFAVRVLRDEHADLRTRMDACSWLADRGFGRPSQVLGLELAEPMIPASELARASATVTEKLTTLSSREDLLSHPLEAGRAPSDRNDGAPSGPQAECKSAAQTLSEKLTSYFSRDGRPP
jgi:hypothetical protein